MCNVTTFHRFRVWETHRSHATNYRISSWSVYVSGRRAARLGSRGMHTHAGSGNRVFRWSKCSQSFMSVRQGATTVRQEELKRWVPLAEVIPPDRVMLWLTLELDSLTTVTLWYSAFHWVNTVTVVLVVRASCLAIPIIRNFETVFYIMQ